MNHRQGPRSVFELIDEFFAVINIMLAASQSCVDARSFRCGKSREVQLSPDGLQFPLEAASLFAAHSAALSISYLRGDRNTLDENVSSMGYIKALGDIAEWELTENEEAFAEIISLNTWRACLHMASCVRDIPEMNEKDSLFLGCRPKAKRNDDGARIADAARSMFNYLQKELLSQQLDVHRDGGP